MFINTSSRLNKFYTSNKTAIDTLNLIAQLIGYAIALLGLLAILGWALAISQAVAWLNQLVEDSLESPQVYLLMPTTDTDNTADANVPNVSTADAILAEWQNKAALTAPELPDWDKDAVAQAADRAITTDEEILAADEAISEALCLSPAHDLEVDDRDRSVGQTDTWIALSGYTIRELKKMASDRAISKYSNLTKNELILALS
jgi:Rho termination factor, N-terminal domain